MSRPLTPANARDIRPGEVLKDTEVRGLQLHGGARGASWKLYYRTKNRDQRKPKLGTFPELNIARARDAARDLLVRVAKGDDPSAEWRTHREGATVADLATKYVATWLPRKKPKSRETDEGYLRNPILPALGRMRVADVTIDDVETFLLDVKRRRYVPATHKGAGYPTEAPYAANRVRALLSKMFALAEERWKMRPRGSNPVKGSLRNVERRRRRAADPAELRRLAEALRLQEASYPRQVALILVIMYSGARVGEIAFAKPSQRQGDVLSLRDHKTEATTGDKLVYLPRRAVEILDRQGVAPDGTIFGGKLGLRHVWTRVRKAAGCPDLQLRDARRTFASYAKTQGVTLDQIADLFGHTNTQTTLGYAYLFADAKRLTTNAVADEIGRHMDERPSE